MTWLKVVERKGQSILISSYFYNGIQTNYFKDALGIAIGLNKYLIIDYSNYYDQKEVEIAKNLLDKKLKETNFEFLQIFFNIFYKKAQELIEFSNEIKQMKSKQLKNNMFGLFLTFSNKCLEFAPAMYLPILVENIVQDEIKKIIKENIKTNNYDYFELFTSSSKPTEGSDELLHLYKIAKNPDRKNIQNHLRQYQWLSYTKWSGQLWTEKTIKDRIKQLGTIDIDENIEELDQFYHFNKQKTKKIITKYNILKRDETKIWLAKELAYFRTYRLDVYTKVGYNILNLFEIISKKFGINREDLVCLTYQEILDLLKNNKKADKERIKQRQKNAWQMKFDKGKIDITHNNFEIREKHGSKNVVLKGICAFPGKVKGRVKIIRGVLEFNKMEKNAILVTSMTTPDFAPLMEKAKAIITDEGGITCHASIVARELHKPCLIGTKYATKMLKDGDMVVLDTDKGIVKIIRK